MDLLNALTPEELLYSPSPEVGPFWKQFRHVGRVQECYMQALDTGVIDFSVDYKIYAGGPRKIKLQQYLLHLDAALERELSKGIDWSRKISWPGESPDLHEHFKRMLDHEVLHHGQWVVYMRLLGKPFPSRWSVWGL